MAENLMTQKGFQMRTGKSRAWQWQARNRGELGYYNLNGQIRYSEKHLEDFLKRCEVSAHAVEAEPEAETNLRIAV